MGRRLGIWGLALLGCALTILLGPLGALAQKGYDVRINTIDVELLPVEVLNRIRATLSIVDSDGQPVKGLGLDAFTIMEDGRAIKGASIEPMQAKLDIVVVIDTSGSMKTADATGHVPLQEIKNAVAELIKGLGEDDEVALVAFDSTVKSLVDFTYDHNAILNAANALEAKGWTCLYDAAYRGVEKAAQRPQGQRAVVVFTDGVDEQAGGKLCSVHTLQEVVDKASKESIQVPIYTVGLKGETIAEAELRKMAEETGGRAAMTPKAEELTGLFRTLAEQLKNQYAVTFKSEASAGLHELAAKVSQGGTFGDSQVKSFYIPTQKPVLQFTNLVSGQELRDPITVAVDVLSQCKLEGFRAEVDGQVISEAKLDGLKLSVPLEGGRYSAGKHMLRVQVVDCNNLSSQAEVAFVVPSEGSGVTATAVSPGATPPCAPATPHITSPLPGATNLQGLVVIEGDSRSNEEQCWSSLALYIDGQQVADHLPYSWDTTGATKGPHQIRLVATGRDGKQLSEEVAVQVAGGGGILRPLLVLLLLLVASVMVALLMIRRRRTAAPQPASPWAGSGPIATPMQPAAAGEDLTMDMGDAVATLVVRESLTMRPGETISLLAKDYRVGRLKADNDIVIEDQPVSRRHAVLRYHGDGFGLCDLGSSLGTSVNGSPVPKGGELPLRDGDEIRLGTRTVLKFEMAAPSSDDLTQDVGTGDRDATEDVGGGGWGPYRTSEGGGREGLGQPPASEAPHRADESDGPSARWRSSSAGEQTSPSRPTHEDTEELSSPVHAEGRVGEDHGLAASSQDQENEHTEELDPMDVDQGKEAKGRVDADRTPPSQDIRKMLGLKRGGSRGDVDKTD